MDSLDDREGVAVLALPDGVPKVSADLRERVREKREREGQSKVRQLSELEGVANEGDC